MGERVVNIDADVLKYQLGWAVQKMHWTYKADSSITFNGKRKAQDWWKEENFDDFNEEDWDVEEVLEPWENCRYLIDTKIENIVYETKADQAVLCISPPKCFRDDIATIAPYKGNRPTRKPEYSEKILEHMILNYDCLIGDNVEADDVMGYMQDTDSVIATIDKDLDMIPGEHYNFDKQETYFQDLLSADEWFFVQLLAGDRTDNIKGIPQVGIKTAQDIVESWEGDHAGLVEEVKELYDLHYPEGGLEAMCETAALVWILRKGETPETAGWRKLLDVEA